MRNGILISPGFTGLFSSFLSPALMGLISILNMINYGSSQVLSQLVPSSSLCLKSRTEWCYQNVLTKTQPCSRSSRRVPSAVRGCGKGSGCKSTHKSPLPSCLATLTHPFLSSQQLAWNIQGTGSTRRWRGAVSAPVGCNTALQALRLGWLEASSPLILPEFPRFQVWASLWRRANLTLSAPSSTELGTSGWIFAMFDF